MYFFPAAGQTIQVNGVQVGPNNGRGTLDFVAGAGVVITPTDDAPAKRIILTLNSEGTWTGIYQNLTTAVVMNNGAPGPVSLNGPAIPLTPGSTQGLWILTFEVEVTDVAPSLIALAARIDWGNQFYQITTQLQSINGVTRLRLTMPVPVNAPTVGTATQLTFIAGALGIGQALAIAAPDTGNFSVFRYLGTVFPANWT